MLIFNFDTHTYVKKLVAAGMPERQAEIQADTFKDIIDSQLATKKDLKETETELKRDIKELDLHIKELDLKIETMRKDIKQDIKELQLSKFDIIKWVAGMLVAQGAIVATIVKLLSR